MALGTRPRAPHHTGQPVAPCIPPWPVPVDRRRAMLPFPNCAAKTPTRSHAWRRHRLWQRGNGSCLPMRTRTRRPRGLRGGWVASLFFSFLFYVFIVCVVPRLLSLLTPRFLFLRSFCRPEPVRRSRSRVPRWTSGTPTRFGFRTRPVLLLTPTRLGRQRPRASARRRRRGVVDAASCTFHGTDTHDLVSLSLSLSLMAFLVLVSPLVATLCG